MSAPMAVFAGRIALVGLFMCGLLAAAAPGGVEPQAADSIVPLTDLQSAPVAKGLPANSLLPDAKTPKNISPQAWSRIMAQLQANTYAIEADARHPGSLSASNPAQHFTARFDARGVSIVARGPANATVRIGLRGADSATPVIADGRAEYRHPGYTEWFVNTPQGLEQGWTLNQRDATRGERRVDIAVNKGIVFANGGDAISIRDVSSRLHYRYAALKAWDSNQRALPAHMVARSGNRIRIAVNDREAVYPVTVDPVLSLTLTQVATLTASDASTNSYFGSVAVSGDTVAVGADSADSSAGVVYVFLRNQGGPDAWGQVARLASTQRVFFGEHVALDGDTLVVGSNLTSSSAGSFVFSRNQGGANAW